MHPSVRRLTWRGLALAASAAWLAVLAGACSAERTTEVRATASGSLVTLPGERAEVDSAPVYTDRRYTFKELGELAGLRHVATANEDKTFVARNFLELEAASGTTVYLALDRRDPTVRIPAWLAEEGFKPLPPPAIARFRVSSGDLDARFVVWVRHPRRKTDLLTLGGNVDQPLAPTASLSMYLLFYRGALTGPVAEEVVRQRARESAAAAGGSAAPFRELPAAGGRDALCRQDGPLPGRQQVLEWSRSRPRPRADFRCAQLAGLDFSAASVDFRGADLIAADLHDANLSTAVLDRVEMEHANLANARLTQASLRYSNLIMADLSGARLTGADLEHANLSGAKLDKAVLTAANLESALFEPASLPPAREIAFANRLEGLRYVNYPDALIALRDGFKKDGFRRQEREVTAAIERQKAARARPLEHWARYLLFGLTCDYGSAVARPLLIVGASILLFPLLYYAFARWHAGSRLQLIDGDDRSVAPRDLPDDRRWRYCFQLGLVSAFALGGPFDVGKWIERLLPTSISVRARGGLRTLCGLQSLLDLALLTLWLLIYLGRPFE